MSAKIIVNIVENRPIRYDIDISLNHIKDVIKKYADEKAFFIVDEAVYSLHEPIMPKDRFYKFKATESNKSLESVESILKWLKDNGAIRDSKIVAIGGGITGDMSAFAASIYMRGIKVIQVPTTLLSMVDSSVGGKCGVNFQGIKNNIGSFFQPNKVYIDITFLKTLPDDEFLNGLAESVKVALIADSELFYFIKDNIDLILSRNNMALTKVISTSCSLKAHIVELDERESGIRKFLNFGHTIAHAIETDSNYEVKHGFAVATGIAYEIKLARNLNLISDETYDLIIDTLKKLGYSTEYKVKDRQVFLNAVLSDKKATKQGITVALTTDEMKGTLKNVSAEDILKVLV